MARKPLEGSNIDNVLKYGTGAINIDGCRVGNEERKHKGMSSLGVMHDDDWKPKDIEVTSQGRYPANVMHDGSDVVRDIFPKTTSTKITRERKAGSEFGQNSGWNKHNNRDSGLMPAYGDEGSASRYFYCPKTSAEERNRGLESFTAKPMAWGNQAKAELKRGNLDFKGNQGDGSKHNKVAMRLNTHPTVKPQELMKYLCRLVTPKGGVVLDPFMGSGSTGMAAKDEGFDFIGIEKEEEYFEIASARIKVSSPLMEFM